MCPLTTLEMFLRGKTQGATYDGGFIEHYLLAAIYPDGLTRGVQIGLGVFVLALNFALYARTLAGRRRASDRP